MNGMAVDGKSWEESRGELEFRLASIERVLSKILWTAVAALLTLVVHGVVTVIQMGSHH